MAEFVRVPEADWKDILDATREKTGSTEKLLSGVVAAAVRGIETGGGLAYDMGEFVLDADTNAINKYIPHSLGEAPEFILVWTDDYVGVTNPDTVNATSLGFIWLDGFMGLDNWYTTAAVGTGRGTTVNFYQSRGDTGMTVGKPNSSAYTINPDDVSADSFPLVKIGNTTYYRAGKTYKYFVSKAWWNVGGVANAE